MQENCDRCNKPLMDYDLHQCRWFGTPTTRHLTCELRGKNPSIDWPLVGALLIIVTILLIFWGGLAVWTYF